LIMNQPFRFSGKFIFSSLFGLFILFFLPSQAQYIPDGVSFQAVARDNAGVILSNATVEVRISVLNGGPTGTVLGTYTYQKNTDAFGQFVVALGNETPLQSSGFALASIDWLASSRWIKVEFRPGTSGNYVEVSNAQASASFYAFASRYAVELKTAGTNGQYLTHNGTNWVAGNISNNTQVPSIKRFTSGSSTYTPAAGIKYLRIRMAGGGGAGGSFSGGIAGLPGSSTVFSGGGIMLTAPGGLGGQAGASGNLTGGQGGSSPTAVGSNATIVVAQKGGGGKASSHRNPFTGMQVAGGSGGETPFFGGGAAAGGATALAGEPNSGGGGAGRGGNETYPGSGGGSGAYLEVFVNNPSGTYSYTVGGGGSGSGSASGGGNGGSGIIIIEEYY
jgi:hypothetical protein